MANSKSVSSRQSPASNYSALLVFMGSGTCVASLLSLLVFPTYHFGATDIFPEKVVVAATMVVVFLLYFALASWFSSLRGEVASCSIGALGAAAFALGAFLPGQSPLVHTTLNCVAAAGIAALITVWFVDLCLRPRNLPLGHVSGSFAIGLAFVAAECFFDFQVRDVAVTIAWCVSLVIAFFQLKQHVDAKVPPAVFDRKVVDTRSRIKVESYVMMAVLSGQMGFLMGMGYVDFETTVPYAVIAALVASVAVAIDAFRKKPVVSERSLFSLTTPLTVAAFLCLYLFGMGVSHAIAICVIAALAAVYSALGTVALSSHVILERLAPVRSYAKSRAINYAALSIGIVVGYTSAQAFETSALAGIQLTAAVAIAYSFVASFFHRPRFPDSTLNLDSRVASPSQDKGQWHERCHEVGERYGLSERQREVMSLIAQGRNAEYVANALTISVSTVQTHIRNIYQKLGVHSRQELMDLIEGTKLYGED